MRSPRWLLRRAVDQFIEDYNTPVYPLMEHGDPRRCHTCGRDRQAHSFVLARCPVGKGYWDSVIPCRNGNGFQQLVRTKRIKWTVH